MNITITGPRSVGKSTISKLVAMKLKKKYISSDELGENALKKYGGLDMVIKSGKIKSFVKKGGYSIVLGVYEKEKNFVFDLSGGAFTSESMMAASKKVRTTAKKKSVVFGLLPSRNVLISVFILFDRERKRPHFKNSNKIWLFWETLKKYPRKKRVVCENANFVIYTRGKNAEEVARDICERVSN